MERCKKCCNADTDQLVWDKEVCVCEYCLTPEEKTALDEEDDYPDNILQI
jgi:hypothetical protein